MLDNMNTYNHYNDPDAIEREYAYKKSFAYGEALGREEARRETAILLKKHGMEEELVEEVTGYKFCDLEW